MYRAKYCSITRNIWDTREAKRLSLSRVHTPICVLNNMSLVLHTAFIFWQTHTRTII